ncbi:Cell cycle serine/threonine-protein kinase cdc5/MSD2, partial [Linnemannia exigua]
GLKIGDFGQSALHLPDDKEEPDLPRYELRYAAPEQLQSGKGSFQVDVWSLGISLHEVVVGYSPILDDLFKLIPDERFQDLSKDCQDLICSMLTVDPKSRPAPAVLMDYAFFTRPLPPMAQQHHVHVLSQDGQERQEDEAEEVDQTAQVGRGDLSSLSKHQREEEVAGDEGGVSSNTPPKRRCLVLRESDVEYFSDVSSLADDDEALECGTGVQVAPIEAAACNAISKGGYSGHGEEENDFADDEKSETASDEGSQEGSEGVENGDSEPMGIPQYAGFDRDLIDYEKLQKGNQSHGSESVVAVVEKEDLGESSVDHGLSEHVENVSYTSDEDEDELIEVPPY